MILNKNIKNDINNNKFVQKQEQEIIIYDYDMKENLIEIIIQICIQNQTLIYCKEEKNEKEKQYMQIAQNIKQSLDKMRISNGPWQVIVGEKFGSFVTHESFNFLHFMYQDLWYTIFVSG